MPAAKGKGRAKAPKGHKLCAPLPNGEVVKDLAKKSWKIGESIGSGGFGLIYMADESEKSADKTSAQYVIKIEPQGNGPLFSEIAFYQRAAKQEQIQQWKKKNKVSFLGVPPYIAHGLHEHEGDSLRFLVMPRFGTDLHNLWLKANKKFKRETVARIALMMIDALEYMHDHEYVHGDIKGANILCGYKDPKQVCLVDFGLAYRYVVDKQHRKYEPDPRKAHNGTIEYTSIDAHKGANPSRRGDIEILGYVLLHFISGHLPWEDKLSDCNYVRDQKISNMSDVGAFVKRTSGDSLPEIENILQAATDLAYDEPPDYNNLRKCLKHSLQSMKLNVNAPLDFSTAENDLCFEESSLKKVKKIRSTAKKRTIATPANKQSTPKPSSSTDLSSLDGDSVKKVGLSHRKMPRALNGQSSSSSRNKKLISSPQLETESEGSLSDVSGTSDADYSPSRKRQKKTIKGSNSVRKRGLNLRSSKSTTSESDLDNHSSQKSKSSAPLPNSGRKLRTRSPKFEKQNSAKKSNTELGYESGSDDSLSTNANKRTKKISTPKKVEAPRPAAKSSRHSMAPLHTEPILTKNDQLTGEFRGKHPVFVRRRKVNVQKTNAATQTTPSLNKVKSRK